MPQAGDWALMREHIEKRLAGGNPDYASYIIKWLAWAVQNPGKVAEVALIFRGGEGTGKGTLGRAMCRIFGAHGLQVAQREQLSGRFNGHFENACFVFADEASWGGDRAAAGVIYSMVTEDTLSIEVKGFTPFQADNHLKLFMATNEGWAVPAGSDARRWAVFDVAPKPAGSDAHFSYFGALSRAMEHAGGDAAMLHDLLAMPLEGCTRGGTCRPRWGCASRKKRR